MTTKNVATATKKRAKREQQRESIVQVLKDHVLTHGLAKTSLRQLADACGVSNRMLMYYFEDKAEIMQIVLLCMGEELAHKLNVAIPEPTQASEYFTAHDLFKQVAQLTLSDAVRPYMSLWFEVAAAASRGEQPFVHVAQTIGDVFMLWMKQRLAPSTSEDADVTAAAMLAVIDGLGLLRHYLPDTMIASAAERMVDAFTS